MLPFAEFFGFWVRFPTDRVFTGTMVIYLTPATYDLAITIPYNFLRFLLRHNLSSLQRFPSRGKALRGVAPR